MQLEKYPLHSLQQENLSCDPHAAGKVSVEIHIKLSVATHIQLVKSSYNPHVIRKVLSSNKHATGCDQHAPEKIPVTTRMQLAKY
jgi:hypothetical protein